MGNPIAFPGAANVPIVGQPFEILHVVPLVIGRCKCREDNPTFAITGQQAAAQCHVCNRLYFIGALHFDRNSGNWQVSLGCEIPAGGNREQN